MRLRLRRVPRLVLLHDAEPPGNFLHVADDSVDVQRSPVPANADKSSLAFPSPVTTVHGVASGVDPF